MCNLSDGVEAIGIEKATIRSIRSLMETMEWSIEQAMAALKIPEDERGKYMEMLNQRS